jgi:putative hydrolase of the HAD superfamily
MTKALIFDCFGVLYWDDINRLYDLVPAKKLRELSDLVHACDHGFISSEELVEQVAALAEISVSAVEAVIRNKHTRNDKLVERVRELRGTYKTALLTNMGSDTLSTIFDETEQKELFDTVVVSSDVGLIKPSRDIFEFTLERLGVQPEEAIFIDDRPVNTDGAERVGMRSILFSTNSQFERELQRMTDSFDA